MGKTVETPDYTERKIMQDELSDFIPIQTSEPQKVIYSDEGR